MNDRAYNLSILRSIPGLDVDEGVRFKSTRQAYCNEVSHFAANAMPVVADMLESQDKKELAMSLQMLHGMLCCISEGNISQNVLETIELVDREDVLEHLKPALHQLRRSLESLIQSIAEAEMDVPNEMSDAVEMPTMEEFFEAQDPPGIVAPVERPQVEPYAAQFLNLFSLVRDMDYSSAAEELIGLQRRSYGPKVDDCLEKMLRDFNAFRYEAAIGEANRLEGILSPDSAKEDEKKKILAIDDMPDVLNTLKNVLKGRYNVYCVTNHASALKFLVGNTPDLILLDIDMPEMDGFTLLKIIRQLDNCKTIPVVFLTGNVSEESVKASVDAGGNDFIRKPLNAVILFKKIDQYIGRQ